MTIDVRTRSPVDQVRRIVESWFLPDRLTLWQQSGLAPLPEDKD
jgi:hypothetical protein